MLESKGFFEGMWGEINSRIKSDWGKKPKEPNDAKECGLKRLKLLKEEERKTKRSGRGWGGKKVSVLAERGESRRKLGSVVSRESRLGQAKDRG